MKTSRFVSSVIFALLLVGAAIGQVLPDTAQLRAWNQFNEKYQNKWTIRWDDQTGTPAAFYGTKSTAYSSLGDREQIARQFLKDHRAIFKMKSDLSDLSRLRSIESRGVYVVDFQQLYDGIPVLGGEYSVAVGSDKAIQMVGGKYFRSVSCNTTPSITSARALEIALTTTGIQAAATRESSANIVVAPKTESFVLAYRVVLNEWELLIDAKSGSVIDQFERILRIDGTGNVYPKDPVNSSLTTVTIPRLLGAGTTLNGTYVKATNAETGDSYSASQDFRYNPPTYTQHDATHFDDANAYYHVDKMAYQYWPNVGYAVPFKSTASVHDAYPYGHDNAAANIYTGALYFGHGVSLFWDLSKKEDVIYHEYTHAVSGSIGLGTAYAQEQALHEGYSDYHAATFTNQHQIGEWVTRNYADLRTLTTSQTEFNFSRYGLVSYGLNSAGSPHANSMIWSSALWDLRNALGATVTDFLVYQGLVYRHTSNTTFLNAREGVIIADQNFYGGAHLYTIQHTFYLRGIGADGIPPLSVSISGPDWVTGKHYYTYTANVSGGSGNRTYQWYKDAQALGTAQQQSVYSGMTSFTVQCNVHDNGTGENASGSLYVVNEEGGVASPSVADALAMPTEYSLSQNYPNPFNPETQIVFGLPEPSTVNVSIYDLLGRKVKTLIDGRGIAGVQLARWDGTDESGNNLGGGIYFCKMSATGESGKQFTQVTKMALLK